MPVVISGDTGIDLIQDNTVTSAKIVNAAIGATKLSGTQSGSAPVYGCRAWVNFNGTGTVAIRASGNVSSITDNGEGDYTINFTADMPDANYAPTFMLGRDNSNIDVHSAIHPSTAPTASNLRIRTAFASQVGSTIYTDIARINVAIFR
jgi:hypothetical protein